MTEQIIYDRIWMDDYLNQLKQCENDMRFMKDYLNHARANISSGQLELYVTVMKEFGKIEHNFQVMHRTVEQFMYEAQSGAEDLKDFSEWQSERL